MLNKVFAGFVVVFWAAMMAALLRVEIFPEPTIFDMYPTKRVLKKIFANPVPARLNIYRGAPKGEPIGFCRIEIHPKLNGEMTEELSPAQQPDTYEVSSDLKMKLSLFGMTSFVRLRGKSIFNQKLQLKDFDMTTRIGGSRVRVTGDDVTKKMKVLFDFGDIHDERTFDFNQIRGAGFANMFGMPGLANFSLPGNGGLPNLFTVVSGSGASPPQPVTTAYFDLLPIAGGSMRVYVIDSKVDDHMWTKIWVSETDGEVLKVSTSFGLEMVSNWINVEASR